MNYSEAIQFLYGLRWFGAKFGLENTRQLAASAGNPQNQLRFIHVAGTNGKGSTCAMLESIYRAAGLRVGLFTSPHLVSFRERMQVNRQLISEVDVVRLVRELRELGNAGFQPAGSASVPACRSHTGGRMPPAPAARMAAPRKILMPAVQAIDRFEFERTLWARGVTIFVASSRPPRPVSQMTRSHLCSAKNRKAMIVTNSKNVG